MTLFTLYYTYIILFTSYFNVIILLFTSYFILLYIFYFRLLETYCQFHIIGTIVLDHWAADEAEELPLIRFLFVAFEPSPYAETLYSYHSLLPIHRRLDISVSYCARQGSRHA